MRAMAADPVRITTVGDLARRAGTSVRTLQATFRNSVGMTPMDYLRRLRLSRARADLLAADPRFDTVARIAHRWGFTHLGRFAAAYRSRYGVRPSVDLRREDVPAAVTDEVA
jgi:transcriptional regulator GlxA family with amidase domain